MGNQVRNSSFTLMHPKWYIVPHGRKSIHHPDKSPTSGQTNIDAGGCVLSMNTLMTNDNPCTFSACSQYHSAPWGCVIESICLGVADARNVSEGAAGVIRDHGSLMSSDYDLFGNSSPIPLEDLGYHKECFGVPGTLNPGIHNHIQELVRHSGGVGTTKWPGQ